MIALRAHRRDVLAGAAAAAAFRGIVGAAAKPPTLVVAEPADAASLAFARARQNDGAVFHDLPADVVRFWRDAITPATRLEITGLTSWGNYLVLRGCARECGLRLLQAVDVASPVGRRVAWLLG